MEASHGPSLPTSDGVQFWWLGDGPLLAIPQAQLLVLGQQAVQADTASIGVVLSVPTLRKHLAGSREVSAHVELYEEPARYHRHSHTVQA